MIRSVFLMSLVLYWASTVNAFRLQSLCSSDVFRYKDRYVVNSFHRVTFNRTLEKIGSFLIDDEVDFTDIFEEKADVESMEKMRDTYNAAILHLYSNDTLNRASERRKFGSNLDVIASAKKTTSELKNKANPNKMGTINEFLQVFDRATQLVKQLVAFNESAITPEQLTLAQLKDIINNLKIDEGQTFVFKDELITAIYTKKIKYFEWCYIESSDKFAGKNSFGTVELSVILPFTNPKWRPVLTCENINELPEFFSKKMKN